MLNFKYDTRISLNLILFLININFNCKPNFKLNNNESKQLLELLSTIYNVPLPKIISKNTNKTYTSKNTININEYIMIIDLLTGFYEYLNSLNKDKYKLDINNKQVFGILYISKLKVRINSYKDDSEIAKKIPHELSYWSNDKFYIFKENAMIHLYINNHENFKILIKNFFGDKINIHKLFQKFITNKSTDYEIIKELSNYYKVPEEGILTQNRAQKRSKQLSEFFKLDFSNIQKNKKYLDLGGGDGSISYEIGKSLNLDKNKIISADLPNTFSVGEVRNIPDLTYVELDSNTKTLPFKKNEFFVISLFMVLHHISDIETELKEINRILVKDGYLILREHNVIDINEFILIDMIHRIYDFIENQNIPNNKYKFNYSGNVIEKEYGYTSYYKSRDEFNILLNKFGFIEVNNINLFNPKSRYNIDKNYTTIYKKI